jgi:hypothetical protein
MLVTSLDGLIRALDNLRRNLEGDCFDAGTQTHMESYIADCRDAIQNLARELETTKKEVPMSAPGGRLSLKGKFANAGKTLMYPFRESTLKKLRGYVEEVCENLAIAMSSVQLSVRRLSSTPMLQFFAPVRFLFHDFSGHNIAGYILTHC